MSEGLPWFRLYAEIVDNVKIRIIEPEMRWYFVGIMACKCQGILKGSQAHKEQVLMIKLGVTKKELDQICHVLMAANLIKEDFEIIGWDDRQFQSDHAKQRVALHRARKAGKNDVTEVKRYSNGKVTAQDKDKDKDKEQDKEIYIRVSSLGLDKELFDEYRKTRKRLKATNSPRALTQLLNAIEKLGKDGHDVNELVMQANSMGWKSVYAPKGDTNVSRTATNILKHNSW